MTAKPEPKTPAAAEKRRAAARRFQDTRRLSRCCAMQLLYQMDAQQDWQPDAGTLDEFWAQLHQAGEDGETGGVSLDFAAAREFADKLVGLVAANLAGIDGRLRALAENWTMERMNATDRCILRLAAGELLHNPQTPAKAVINEAIELAKEFGDKNSPRFVNGVLDRLYREAQAASPATAGDCQTAG